MNEAKEKVEGLPIKPQRLYDQNEVKARKAASGVGGIVVGVLATLFTGVVLNKVAKINITDKTTQLANTGIEKIKTIPQKFKKSENEVL
jgi:hypothetical protein